MVELVSLRKTNEVAAYVRASMDRKGDRWLAVGAGLAGSGYGLFASVRWAAGLAETWKGRGMPTWPSWRER
ncbi:hypothetical protein [uncultured Actinomyces sp.]|uniref:hypothetical protein n=1 Tax=uncultured Actinomyces sp. TaxID=249061 RepID=UPI00261B0EB2|nr:hypothetical protein [uncultured Actinomyces sp.]